ncbi:MAG: TetR/AcrR family transcriptional regulator [Deltaproteobacteria bacterium]|nr:TetR/AcrR family transcriptional regulator [Deltaproteobacteria bacterium]
MDEIKSRIKKSTLVAKRRNQIVQKAMILFRKKGYHKTTMREICEKSKVNRGSFYDYFTSKDDILNYIYQQMMYHNADFEKFMPLKDIYGWDNLKNYIKSLMETAWNRDKYPIQVLYRETISLDPKTRKEVLEIESRYIQWVMENLLKGLGLSTKTEELEILTNLLVFMSAFYPLRSWNLHHLDQGKVIDLVAELFLVRLKDLHSRQLTGNQKKNKEAANIILKSKKKDDNFTDKRQDFES